MMHSLPWIRRFSKRYPAVIITISLALVACAGLMISGAGFDTDVTRLIPRHAEKTALYFSIIEEFGGIEKAYIILSAEDMAGHTDTVDRIGGDIIASGFADGVQWKVSEDTRAFMRDVFAKKAPLMLSGAEMKEFAARLTRTGMERELARVRQRLMLPGADGSLARLDPLNLHEIFSSRLRFTDVPYDYRSGYFTTGDGRSVIMVMTPRKSPRDIAFSAEFVSAVEKILDGYRDETFSAELTGSHAIALHEARTMKREIIRTASLSLVTVLLIFLFFFRSAGGLLFVTAPVMAAIVTSMGGGILLTGALSEVTGAFAGLVVGLGIDLGIVLYVRHLVTGPAAGDAAGRMDSSISGVYRGITTGVVTTACIFLPMALSSFRGIRELGLLTGAGILLCWFFLFGAASVLIRPSSGRPIELSFLARAARRSAARPLAVIAFVVAVSIVMMAFIPRIRVTGDIAELGSRDNRAREALEQLGERVVSRERIFITGTAGDLDSALLRSLEIRNAVAGELTGIAAPSDLLPPKRQQESNMKVLRSMDSQQVARTFSEVAAAQGFNPGPFRQFLTGLSAMIDNRDPLRMEDLGPMRQMLDRLMVNNGGRWKVLVTGSPAPGASPVFSGAPSYTGPVPVRQELLGILTRDGVIITVVGLILVNIVLYIDFRNIFHVILCQVPVAAGILWLLGVMGLSGITLNFMNAVVFVMIIGIGTDYTVHLLHRYRADRDMEKTFLHTGKAVVVAALTTVAGFGSIGFSSYRGLASMGQVAAIGTVFCAVLSLVLIPGLLGISERRRPPRSSGGDGRG